MAQGAGAAVPNVRVVHHVPGRLRMRMAGARDEAELLDGVKRLLVGVSGCSQCA